MEPLKSAALCQRHRYVGVSGHGHGKWGAYISRAGGATKYLGVFGSEAEAARVFDAAARDRDGAAARVNFPRRGSRERQAVKKMRRRGSGAAADDDSSDDDSSDGDSSDGGGDGSPARKAYRRRACGEPKKGHKCAAAQRHPRNASSALRWAKGSTGSPRAPSPRNAGTGAGAGGG